MQPSLMNNQAWYEAKWSVCAAYWSDEHLQTAVCNGRPRSMQDKLHRTSQI
jgi:hypothetical protein